MPSPLGPRLRGREYGTGMLATVPYVDTAPSRRCDTKGTVRRVNARRTAVAREYAEIGDCAVHLPTTHSSRCTVETPGRPPC